MQKPNTINPTLEEDAYKYCQNITYTCAKTFYFASYFLSQKKGKPAMLSMLFVDM